MAEEDLEQNIQRAIELILAKQQNKEVPLRFVALTGSGISKGSGIPTFRGEDGLWKNYNVMELATPQAFRKNPQLVWEWYAWRIGLILEKSPNPAHHALATLEKEKLLSWVITQNVDNLHQRAGTQNLLQVHGNIFRAWCMHCGFEKQLVKAPREPPQCSRCQNLLRPGVVWFGESLDHSILAKCLQILTQECDVLLVVGTSGVVYPVADFPRVAKQHGAILLEFNLTETPISLIADYRFSAPAEKTLPSFTETLLKAVH